MGKSSPGGDQTTTQSPWPGVQPYLTGGPNSYQPGLFPKAGQLYARGDPLYAKPSDDTKAGWKGQRQYANELDSSLLQPYQDAGQFALTGATDINNNPALQQAMSAATRPYEQQLAFGTLPGIGREFTGAGQYGSSRQGVSEGVAEGLTNQAILDTRGKMASQAYGQGLDHQAKGMALYPSVLESGMMPSRLVADIGQQKEGFRQQHLDTPYERLRRYADIIQPGSGIGGMFSGPGPGGPSKSQQALGSAATMASIYALLTLASGGTAAPAAASAGNMALLPSDIRLKTNIEKIDTVNGVNIYSWDWKAGGSSKGVIAQEVEQRWPDVVFDVDGVKMVNYLEIARRI